MTKIITILYAIVQFLRWLTSKVDIAQGRAEGRAEVTAEVNKETANAQDRMASVPDPTDSDVSRRMRDGTF